jgi:hypothetical protein
MKSQPQHAQPPPDQWIRQHPAVAMVGTIEAAAGVCITGFFAVVVVGMVGGSILLNSWMGNKPFLESRLRMGLTIGWLLFVLIAGRSLHLLMQAIHHAKPPTLISAASRWLGTPLLLRPAVALWWTMLALASPLGAHYAMAQINFIGPTPGEIIIERAAPCIILLAASIANNTNALIAVAALTGSPGILRLAWRARLLFDLATTAGIYFAHLPVVTFSSWAGGI